MIDQRPLAGIRVLDFSQFLSGPYCTQVLADMGADVIKVETPDGDGARSFPPYFVERDSVYFLAFNRSKKSMVIDLKTGDGRDLLLKLAAKCDVVVENFRPGVLDKLKVGETALRAVNPDLIWCSISGYGQDGPYRDKPAYDMIVQALSGGMSMTGEPGRQAVRAGIPIGDISAGLYGAIAIIGALYRRERVGAGDAIDISMLDCQAAMLSYQAAYYLHAGKVPGRQGSAHDSIATYRSFTAGDGREVVVCAITERMWQGLCRVLERTDLIDDLRFRTSADRFANRGALWAELEPAFLRADADSWVPKLERESIPVGMVNTMDRVMTDPQIQHRGMVTELSADGRTIRVMGNPIRFKETESEPGGYPPALGQDTETILKDLLGLSEAEIAGLQESRAIPSSADAAVA